MFGLGKKKKPEDSKSNEALEGKSIGSATVDDAADQDEAGIFARLKNGLSRTRSKISDGLAEIVLGEKTIDLNLLEEIESQLLSADIGIDATDQIIDNLKKQLGRKQLADPEQFMTALRQELTDILEPVDVPLIVQSQSKPFVILMVGVNGVGKTTSIGKLAKLYQSQGLNVMLAAGDTFRAAAVEQLQVWGERNSVPVVAQATGADSASVIFDAYQSAKAKNVDVLIADTAGRLHTKDNLMNELEKIVRVLKKQDERLPDEVLLVLDATTGQNAVNQAESFHKTTTLSGIALTKLDGTAKGGVVFALAKKLSLPIRFIGVGEKIDDLRPFNAKDYVDALFSE
ncbi:MAG: signal recognition particle-docking protein FtsY [Proteobacteria bacterium]|jgi:fused signal recognition particle receptor|nr:signal recognition particle-docking protein FtsY [Pseudomonadota bacterium]MDA1290022.1 signal recognition particle-docking protein FtsY [Pseudomonadota bacterium]